MIMSSVMSFEMHIVFFSSLEHNGAISLTKQFSYNEKKNDKTQWKYHKIKFDVNLWKKENYVFQMTKVSFLGEQYTIVQQFGVGRILKNVKPLTKAVFI